MLVEERPHRKVVTVSCRSSVCEPTATPITTVSTIRRHIQLASSRTFHATRTAFIITNYVTPPLALVTNGLSLIIFARMYRAKQQVINRNMYSLDN